jgi:anti-sigma B factor antagonist
MSSSSPSPTTQDGDEGLPLTVAFTTPESQVLLATVKGDLDLSTAPVLDNRVRSELRRRSPGVLVMDLAGLQFLGLHGTAVLERIRRRATADGIGLILVAVPAVGERALHFAGVLDRFSHHADLTTALAVTAGGRPSVPAS